VEVKKSQGAFGGLTGTACVITDSFVFGNLNWLEKLRVSVGRPHKSRKKKRKEAVALCLILTYRRK